MPRSPACCLAICFWRTIVQSNLGDCLSFASLKSACPRTLLSASNDRCVIISPNRRNLFSVMSASILVRIFNLSNSILYSNEFGSPSGSFVVSLISSSRSSSSTSLPKVRLAVSLYSLSNSSQFLPSPSRNIPSIGGAFADDSCCSLERPRWSLGCLLRLDIGNTFFFNMKSLELI